MPRGLPSQPYTNTTVRNHGGNPQATGSTAMSSPKQRGPRAGCPRAPGFAHGCQAPLLVLVLSVVPPVLPDVPVPPLLVAPPLVLPLVPELALRPRREPVVPLVPAEAELPVPPVPEPALLPREPAALAELDPRRPEPVPRERLPVEPVSSLVPEVPPELLIPVLAAPPPVMPADVLKLPLEPLLVPAPVVLLPLALLEPPPCRLDLQVLNSSENFLVRSRRHSL